MTYLRKRHHARIGVASALLSFGVAAGCSSATSTEPSSPPPDPTDPSTGDGAVGEEPDATRGDANRGDADAGDAKRPPGDVSADPTGPTSCNDVCANVGLTCKETDPAAGVGYAGYKRADGTACGRGILHCDEIVSPTDTCSSHPSVSVGVTCHCQ